MLVLLEQFSPVAGSTMPVASLRGSSVTGLWACALLAPRAARASSTGLGPRTAPVELGSPVSPRRAVALALGIAFGWPLSALAKSGAPGPTRPAAASRGEGGPPSAKEGPPAIPIALNPIFAAPGQKLQLSAAVSGAAPGALTWSVREGAAGGSVGPTGVYVAPSRPGVYHVEAATKRSPSAVATCLVYVQPPDAIVPPMAVISRQARAFASAGNASAGNSMNYQSAWTAPSTAWLAYDLSPVPASKRARVMVSWTLPNAQRYHYRWDANPGPPHSESGVPGPYVLEGSSNSTSGGDGTWTVLFEDQAPQEWKARTHLLDFAGYTWIRYRGTGNNPIFSSSPGTTSIHLDVHDASSSAADSWAMFGDSITGAAWRWSDFPVRVQAKQRARFPVVQASGIAFTTTSMVLENWWEHTPKGTLTHFGQTWFDRWLAMFPGRYVVLAYGTNDTNGRLDAFTFRSNFQSLVDKVLAAGKVPVIPSVIWNSTNDSFIRQANDILGVRPGKPPARSLKAKYGAKILSGPDLYGIFEGRKDWIENNGAGLHPTGELSDIGSGATSGYGAYRQAWADWALATLYGSGA
jgi:hypothetical protein